MEHHRNGETISERHLKATVNRLEVAHLPYLQIQYILGPTIRKANNEKDYRGDDV